MAGDKIRIGVLGASGYTGADLVRLALRHPDIEISVLTANSQAGRPISSVYPHLHGFDLPDLVTTGEADWGSVDAVFCGLPHGTTQKITRSVLSEHPGLRFIDLSADFRLRDGATYAEWYGHDHAASDLQEEAVYGLTEVYREAIREARLVACPGCYPTAAILALVPLIAAGAIDPADIVIDAKSGVSGSGRGLKEASLFCEAGEGMGAYGVSRHRHMPEIEQELGVAAGSDIRISFTPHLVPMSRGEFLTIYVRLALGWTAADLRSALQSRFEAEPFVDVLPEGMTPKTQMARGSNKCLIGVFEDRLAGRAIVMSTLDNLVKGSSGQAIQNFNLMFGIEEVTGLEQVALFP